ncbi:hypothetical protein HNR56_001121 [Roseospira marina]|nr:hypothetical protein [Roseospira marina]MBB5086439.1 hypothetical protein [Roseospira marina]
MASPPTPARTRPARTLRARPKRPEVADHERTRTEERPGPSRMTRPQSAAPSEGSKAGAFFCVSVVEA